MSLIVHIFDILGLDHRNYIGELGGGLTRELMLTTDKTSHVYSHVAQKGHVINEEDFSIIGSGYGSYKEWKISEALHIHQKKPNLNKRKEAVPFKLFI